MEKQSKKIWRTIKPQQEFKPDGSNVTLKNSGKYNLEIEITIDLTNTDSTGERNEETSKN